MPSSQTTSVQRTCSQSYSAAFSTADLFDAYMNCPQSKLQFCAPGMVSFGGRTHYSGQIATVRSISQAPMRLRDILDEPGAGRVLIADGQACAEWALLGDRMASLALAQGWSGVILNGYVRDVAALRHLSIGIHALGSIPSRPAWSVTPTYSRDESLDFQGCTFTPGSWIYADEDGILIADRCLVESEHA